MERLPVGFVPWRPSASKERTMTTKAKAKTNKKPENDKKPKQENKDQQNQLDRELADSFPERSALRHAA